MNENYELEWVPFIRSSEKLNKQCYQVPKNLTVYGNKRFYRISDLGVYDSKTKKVLRIFPKHNSIGECIILVALRHSIQPDLIYHEEFNSAYMELIQQERNNNLEIEQSDIEQLISDHILDNLMVSV